MSCQVAGRNDQVRGRSQLRGISLRHAANIAVFEGTAACPLNHFTDGLLPGRGHEPCRCQELVAKLVESRTSRRPVTVVVGRRRGGPVGGWLARSVPAMLRVSFLSCRATPTPPAQQNGHPRQVLQLLSGDQRGGTPSFEDGWPDEPPWTGQPSIIYAAWIPKGCAANLIQPSCHSQGILSFSGTDTTRFGLAGTFARTRIPCTRTHSCD